MKYIRTWKIRKKFPFHVKKPQMKWTGWYFFFSVAIREFIRRHLACHCRPCCAKELGCVGKKKEGDVKGWGGEEGKKQTDSGGNSFSREGSVAAVKMAILTAYIYNRIEAVKPV